MLASDLNNPEFSGPTNPDAMVQVEFYDFEAVDKWKTEETGIKAFKPSCPFVRISVPGRQDLTVERPADARDTQRFPRQWMVYQMQTGKIANAENVPGWQIADWSELDPEQVRQLQFLRFYTVEQIAGANDAQVQGIGMGGLGLREKAKRALAERNGQAASNEIAKRDERIAALEEKLNLLLSASEEKRGPGRPKAVNA